MSGHFFVLLFMLSVSPFCVCVCRFCRCLKVWCSATILLKRVLVWVCKTSEDGDALVSLCVLSASLCWKIFLLSCVEQNNIIFLFFCRLLSFVADCLSCYGRQSAWRSFLLLPHFWNFSLCNQKEGVSWTYDTPSYLMMVQLTQVA